MELLPLGTVVKRKTNTVPIMIIGYFPYDVEENLWQYIGTNIFLGTGLESDKLALMRRVSRKFFLPVTAMHKEKCTEKSLQRLWSLFL